MGSDLGSAQIKAQILTGPRWRVALVALAFAAAVLYLAGVPRNPPGFYIDESSIAYNAHTISQTGCDEHGAAWPLYFRAFGDYKNPTFVYLLAGLFYFTGPSILAARLLSAGIGILAALVLGVLAARVMRDPTVGLLTTISALLTPWLFETSRVVMEVALYPLVLGLFLLCLHRVSAKQRWSRIEVASLAIMLALLTYTYSIGRLLGPLLAAGLAFFWSGERWRSVVRTWCAYAVLLIPIVIFTDKNPGALTERFKIITYFTPQGGVFETVLEFCSHYLSNLNVWRLLVSGDPNPDQVAHIFGTGHFLAATFVFSAAGVCVVLRKQARDAWWRFAFYGLAISVVPASLTNEHFHMLRLIALPVFLLVFAGTGIAWFLESGAAQVRRGTFILLLAFTVTQAAGFQWMFHRHLEASRRVDLFDAKYRNTIFAPAVASPMRPIYLADALAIPGYIQAYWYATLARLDLSSFVRLPSDEPPPQGALIITTEENCPRCEIIAKLDPYTVYIANAPPRERVPLPEEGFRAELSVVEAPGKLRPKERAVLRVSVKNISRVTWLARERSGGKLQVSLGNHWLDTSGKTIVGDDGRSALLEDLAPSEETELRLTVNAPRQRGQYILEIDMLQEGVSWFARRGSRTAHVRVHVD